MKKVFIIAHRFDQPEIVNNLQEAGLIEISEISPEEDIGSGEAEKLYGARAEQIGFEITKFDFVLDFLAKARPKAGGLINGLIKNRVVVNFEEFNNIDKKVNFETLYEKCEDLDARLSSLNQESEELKTKKSELSQWLALDIRFDQIESSRYVGLTIGRIKRENLGKLTETLAAERTDTDLNIVGSKNQAVALAIIYYAPRAAALERLLMANGFERTEIGDLVMTASQEMEELDARISIVEEATSKLHEEIEALADYSDDLLVLLDWLQGKQARYEAQSRLGQTDSTFILQGWAQATNIAKIEEILKAHEAVVDFDFTEPTKKDKVPVVIRNPRLLRPFETLTRLYGMPNYRELDPTPIMAGFFFLFFGLSIGDVGYGVVLVAFCLWLRSRLLITAVGKEWLTLFALGGVASAIIGIFTGSYFSLDPKVLPEILKRLIVIDPLEQAFVFLLFTWALGVVHILAGLGIEFWDSWRRKDYEDAINMSVGKIAVLISGTIAISGWFAISVFEKKDGFYSGMTSAGVQGLAISSLFFVLLSGGMLSRYFEIAKKSFTPDVKEAKRLENVVASILLILLLFSILISFGNVPRVLIALSIIVVGMIINGPTRQVVVSFLGGIYNLYGLSTYIGDILSYSRLMALGLATFLIGFAINTIAGLVTGFAPWGIPVGILLALVIAIPFHIFNLVINLLGAFVHPLRLQFVEFFGKFYENGGRPFNPFSYKTDRLIFKEE